MTHHRRITLSRRSYVLLEGLLQQLEPGNDILRAMIGRKLATADIAWGRNVGSQIATLDSRVRFRIDGGSAQDRTLVWAFERELGATELPVATPRGVALLGMHVGQTAPVPTLDGCVEHLTLEAVLRHPEVSLAAGQVAPGGACAPGQQARALVTSLTAVRERRRAAWGLDREGDDPGPSAA